MTPMSRLAKVLRFLCLLSWICPLVLCADQSAAKGRNENLTLGVVVPLSGSTATFGMDCLAGLNLAIEGVNQRGGIKGKLLILEVRDNQGDPLRSAQEVASLAETNALAVIGAVTSNNTLAAATVAQSEGISLLTPYATYAAVTEVGDYISRICFTDLQQAIAMAYYAYNALGLRKIAILSEKDSHYSKSLAEYLSDRFRQLGGQIISDESYRVPDSDVPRILRKYRELKPDAIFLPVYYSDAAFIAKEAIKLGSCKTLLGGDGWESAAFFELAGDTLQDLHIYITSHFSPEDSRTVVQDFVQRFQKKNGRKPNALSALAYDAGMIVADALVRTPQLTRSAIKDAINSTSGFEGVTGTINMNEKRDPKKGVYILEAQRDGFHLRVSGSVPN